MLEVRWIWLLPAFVLFLISKLMNAFRLQAFFNCTGLWLDTVYNIKLYLVGMFYNLFLPGGIGGDGYKVMLLRKVKGVRTRDLITASLLDRVSGLVAIVFLAMGAAIFSELYIALPEFQWVYWLGTVVAFPAYALAIFWIFPRYRWVITVSIFYSLLVQIFIFTSVICILIALNVTDYYIEYYTFFMIAVIASSLPITIGGLGLREAALVYLPSIVDLPVVKDTAVALSLLFMAITIITSLCGIIFNVEKPILRKSKNEKKTVKSSSA